MIQMAGSNILNSIYQILLIEDDSDFRLAISSTLPEEILLVSAANGKEARHYLGKQTFDLILLDLTLPDEDGLKLSSWIRSEERFREIPIMLLTGRAEIEDKVMAFSLGADDYLVKPVDPREFRARVLSRLKKSRRRAEVEQFFCKGNLKFMVPVQQVIILDNGSSRIIEMTPLEFRLLFLLAKNEGRIYSRDELISLVWGNQITVLDRTVDSHVSDLRRKLLSATHTIKSVRGIGYQLAVTHSTQEKRSA